MVVAFWQNVVTPVMAGGGSTVRVMFALPQRFVAVITVLPELMPPLPATPVVVLIVATDGLLLVHVPTGDPSLLSVVEPPRHILVIPVMLVGALFTVIIVVAVVPQPVT